MAWGKKKPSKITTPDGGLVRNVYIQSSVPDATMAVAAQLAQDTCLTAVTSAKHADAVLDLSVALPGLGGGSPTANILGSSPSATPQTLGNAKSGQERSASVTCSDNKGSGGCVGSDKTGDGSLTGPFPSGVPGTGTTNYDIFLASSQNLSNQLWEPDSHSKRPWTDQLRVAAGCPVCPGEHFDRKKFHSYRDWIESRCPAMLKTGQ
jgi:hypothetical protein